MVRGGNVLHHVKGKEISREGEIIGGYVRILVLCCLYFSVVSISSFHSAFRTRKCRSVSANLFDILSRFDTCGAVGQLTAGGTIDSQISSGRKLIKPIIGAVILASLKHLPTTQCACAEHG